MDADRTPRRNCSCLYWEYIDQKTDADAASEWTSACETVAEAP